jgi:hypothetical protein
MWRRPAPFVPEFAAAGQVGSPALLNAIRPQVAVVNNGPRKGLGQIDNTVRSTTPAGTKTTPYERNGYSRLAQIPGIEGIWQGHLSLLDKDPGHNTLVDMIANLELRVVGSGLPNSLRV